MDSSALSASFCVVNSCKEALLQLGAFYPLAPNPFIWITVFYSFKLHQILQHFSIKVTLFCTTPRKCGLPKYGKHSVESMSTLKNMGHLLLLTCLRSFSDIRVIFSSK
jgi:hypothetical protein